MLNLYKAVLLTTLVLLLALLLQGSAWAFDKDKTVAGELHTERQERVRCTSLPSRYSIRYEDLEMPGMGLLMTENGPTGIDGGLIALLSSYRTCSR